MKKRKMDTAIQKRDLCRPTLEEEKTFLPTFRPDAPVVFRAQVNHLVETSTRKFYLLLMLVYRDPFSVS